MRNGSRMPTKFKDGSVMVSARLPQKSLYAIELGSRIEHCNKSEFARRMLRRYFKEKGILNEQTD